MVKYECEYCKDPLCTEVCEKARAAQREWLDSEDFKNIPPLDFIL